MQAPSHTQAPSPAAVQSVKWTETLYWERNISLFWLWVVIFKASSSKHFPPPLFILLTRQKMYDFLKKETVYQEKPTRGLHAPATAKGSFDVITNPTPGSNGVASKGPLSFS